MRDRRKAFASGVAAMGIMYAPIIWLPAAVAHVVSGSLAGLLFLAPVPFGALAYRYVVRRTIPTRDLRSLRKAA